MIFRGRTNEYLQLANIECDKDFQQKEPLESSLTFVWFEKEGQSITIDNVEYQSSANEIFCLTEFHKVNVSGICNAKLLRFNRIFYCVIDHDSEVGCTGILFFGASTLPKFVIPDEELEKFQTIWKMFELEIQSHDDLQLEMLQSMLKRFIILCTRIYKNQHNYTTLDNGKVDIIRQYNFLVEKNFKTTHTVAEYAAMLNKSPKTLSNLFSKLADKTPLQYIQDRRLLEAKRLLNFSDMHIKEIAYEIGFEDSQTFGRFFKKMEGVSPTEFKNE